MKKTYINPNMEVVTIATQQMLAGSPKVSTGTTPTDPNDSDSHFFDGDDW